MQIRSVLTGSLGFLILGIGAWQIFNPQAATSANTQLSQEVAVLRPQGQKGLQKFLQTHSKKLNQADIRTALDQLCQQRDCYASRLYWYTNLEEAKAAAKASGKPILSLRLLGNLDQDLSCANSRFFRVALYPNAEIAKTLQDKFILHWQSVRPVPKVTIDFGDGRKLERTLTGNSIHYILDSSGRPIDAIPGLYSPQAFLQQLQQGANTVKAYSQVGGKEKEGFLRKYHSDRLNTLQAKWTKDLNQAGINVAPRFSTNNSNNPAPSATVAAPIAMTKMLVEAPLLTNIQSSPELTDGATWQRIAQLHRQNSKLDSQSLALIKAKKYTSTNANFDKLIQQFESTMALDTVRNEYILHRRIHQWFAAGQGTSNLDGLNEQVYSQLFLTPSSDPWLGLNPEENYSAIEHDGIIK
ncbi:hypothetical protein [Calothrix sp. 336/3]|uniref:hypothetical protein n=1 Tax=Calothrix sp. 336/3 TaxID=1337936 RepID=UPI0004E33DD2|nr:hypothetical protein [Calothrix sp. 336/3]AKG20291.1 hypothetical protein IJ00_02255 [Calothrix sp. 336/3]